MRKSAQVAIFLSYLAIGFMVLPEFKRIYSLWLEVAVSSLFVFCYVAFAGGRISTSIITVFIFSFVFPIAVLIAIGLPVYHTWSATVTSIISSLTKQQFWGVEMFFPLLAALFGAIIAIRWRSNPSFKRDQLKLAP